MNSSLGQRHEHLDRYPRIEAWLYAHFKDRSATEFPLTESVCHFLIEQLPSDAPPVKEAIAEGLAIADLLFQLHMDDTSLVVAILYAAAPLLKATDEALSTRFGSEIVSLLSGVRRIADIRPIQIDDRDESHLQSEQLRKMLLAMATDIRVVMIRLAERVVCMRAMTRYPEKQRQRMAQEILDIYAPLANRLGIWQLKWELEDLSLRYLEPELYKRIARLLDERRVDRESYIAEVVNVIRDECARAGIVGAKVTGRPKHIYSIWRKMERKHLNYQEIYDVRGVRILVDDINSCYTALGMIHSRWQYIPGEFDDYIATPKENGYRSIHTAVIGPQGKVVEIQIRTVEMHEHNELGVAAHWRYKEGGGSEDEFDRKIAWLRQLLDWRDVVTDDGDIIDRFRTAVFQGRIYVFSPKGRVVDLPLGGTPLDFAYSIHTDVGHCCRGAKVDGQMVPLTYQLQSGQCVEVLTGKRPSPSRDWLNSHLGYLKTSRARNKVQHWFRQQDREKNVVAGRQIMDRELKRMGLTSIRREALAGRLGYDDVAEMQLAVAYSECKVTRFLNAAQELARHALDQEVEHVPLVRPTDGGQRGKGVFVQGVGNLLTNIAQCCKPVPGDTISGYITIGRGISIHRSDCANLERCLECHPERVIGLDWGIEADQTYPVDIRIKAFDRQGLLRDITAVITSNKVNLIGMRTHSDKRAHVARMRLTVEIPDLDCLSKLLMQIGQLPNILDVSRVHH